MNQKQLLLGSIKMIYNYLPILGISLTLACGPIDMTQSKTQTVTESSTPDLVPLNKITDPKEWTVLDSSQLDYTSYVLKLFFPLQEMANKKEEEDAFDRCLIEQTNKFQIESQGSKITFAIKDLQIDGENCSVLDIPATMDGNLLAIYDCEGSDFSKLNGKQAGDPMVSEDIYSQCTQSSKVSIFSRVDYTLDNEEIEGLPAMTTVGREGILTRDGTPCIWAKNADGKWSSDNGCFSFHSSVRAEKATPSETVNVYLEAEFDDLYVDNLEAKFFSGVSNVRINHWEGKAEFSPNGTVNWDLMNPDGEIANFEISFGND
jgi:hypothetical protein